MRRRPFLEQETSFCCFCQLQTARSEKSAGFLQKVVFFLQTADFFLQRFHLLAELDKFLIKRRGAMRGLWVGSKVKTAKTVGPYRAIHGVLGDFQFFRGLNLSNFFGRLHCLYFVFTAILSVFCHFGSLLILLIISQILEYGLSTFLYHIKCLLTVPGAQFTSIFAMKRSTQIALFFLRASIFRVNLKCIFFSAGRVVYSSHPVCQTHGL